MHPEFSSKIDAILAASTADEWFNVDKCTDSKCRLCNPVVGEELTKPAEKFEHCMICFNDRVPPRAIVRCASTPSCQSACCYRCFLQLMIAAERARQPFVQCLNCFKCFDRDVIDKVRVVHRQHRAAFERGGLTVPLKNRLARLALERDGTNMRRGNRVLVSKWRLKDSGTIKCDECNAGIYGEYAQCTVCRVVPPARGQYELCSTCLDQGVHNNDHDLVRLETRALRHLPFIAPALFELPAQLRNFLQTQGNQHQQVGTRELILNLLNAHYDAVMYDSETDEEDATLNDDISEGTHSDEHGEFDRDEESENRADVDVIETDMNEHTEDD